MLCMGPLESPLKLWAELSLPNSSCPTLETSRVQEQSEHQRLRRDACTWTALKSRSARLEPEGTLEAAPPPMPIL